MLYHVRSSGILPVVAKGQKSWTSGEGLQKPSMPTSRYTKFATSFPGHSDTTYQPWRGRFTGPM